MTKSNNEWVPEIGQVVMASWVDDDGDLMDTAVEVSAYRDDKAWVTCCGLDKVFKLTDIKFRPLKTEAEKRRDELTESMRLDIISMWNYEGKDCPVNDFHLSNYLIKQNWIKPKPLTDEVIERLIDKHQNECETLCSFEFARMIEACIRGETP